uniref:Putative ovule protein n=1 Tax=Solanum chacoense TaxID=4108 RepID=A0A0V0H2I6_SOLCH
MLFCAYILSYPPFFRQVKYHAWGVLVWSYMSTEKVEVFLPSKAFIVKTKYKLEDDILLMKTESC